MFTGPGQLIGYKIKKAFNIVADGYYSDDAFSNLYYVDDAMTTYLKFSD